MTASILSAVMGLFRFSASSSFSFGRLYFSRNVSISSRFSNLMKFLDSFSREKKTHITFHLQF